MLVKTKIKIERRTVVKQITAEHCATIRPYLLVQRGNVRIPNIVVVNAILHVLENGCKWRALPERFGKWSAVYARFRRWSQSGVLERLFRRLKGCRRICTRFDKLDAMFPGFLNHALVVEMICDLA